MLKCLLERSVELSLKGIFGVRSLGEILRRDSGRISIEMLNPDNSTTSIDIVVTRDHVDVNLRIDIRRLRQYIDSTLVLKELSYNIFDAEVVLTKTCDVLDFRVPKKFFNSIAMLVGLVTGGISSYLNYLLFNAPVLTIYITDARAAVMRARALEPHGPSVDLSILLDLSRRSINIGVDYLKELIEDSPLLKSLLMELGVVDIEQECLDMSIPVLLDESVCQGLECGMVRM